MYVQYQEINFNLIYLVSTKVRHLHVWCSFHDVVKSMYDKIGIFVFLSRFLIKP